MSVAARAMACHLTGAWPDHGHFVPDIGRCHCYAWNRHHLVGDRLSGAVYEMSHAFLDDVIVGP